MFKCLNFRPHRSINVALSLWQNALFLVFYAAFALKNDDIETHEHIYNVTFWVAGWQTFFP